MENFKIPEIDNDKIEKVKELIEAIESNKYNCINELQEINNICNKNYELKDFYEYWNMVDIDVLAKIVLLPNTKKIDLKDEQIFQIVKNILDGDEVELYYWLSFLELNTGLKNISDYIFYPESDNIIDIANKIIKERIKY